MASTPPQRRTASALTDDESPSKAMRLTFLGSPGEQLSSQGGSSSEGGTVAGGDHQRSRLAFLICPKHRNILHKCPGSDPSCVFRWGALEACGKLTDEQLAPMRRARRPQEIRGLESRITVLLAAAAAGKTTTLRALWFVLRAFGHGPSRTPQTVPHSYVLYVVFNKAAQVDAEAQLCKIPGMSKVVAVKTMHAIAMETTPRSEWNHEMLGDDQMQALILRRFDDEIEHFLGRPPPTGAKERQQAMRERKLVAFWILKTMRNFIVEKGGERLFDAHHLAGKGQGFGKLTYWPVVLNHLGELKGSKRLPQSGNPKTWYVMRAGELWRQLVQAKHAPQPDIYMKFAELLPLKLPDKMAILFDLNPNPDPDPNPNSDPNTDSNPNPHPTPTLTPNPTQAILIDEAQDLSASQHQTFVVQQAHADVFLVSDLVQCLYTWRGARPKQLVRLSEPPPRGVAPREVTPLPLTRSFRFGEGVARIANHLLFIKKSSKQRALWHHYTIVGAGPATIAIHEADMAPPYTAISRTNVALALEAWRLLSEEPGVTIIIDAEATRKQLTAICNQAVELAPHHEEAADFTFKGTVYSGWADFTEQCEEREETLLLGCISILDKVGKDAVPDLVQRLRQVLSCREPDADVRQVVRLTNACQAKGLEWDRVKVLDELPR